MNPIKSRSTHAARLDRWLGPEQTERISRSMRDWYGPPIAVAGLGGAPVFAHKGGDFRGAFDGGHFGGQLDYWLDRLAGFGRGVARRQRATAHAGFTSISDMVAEASTGKRRDWHWQKAGATGVVGVTNSLWGVGNQPAAGANAASAPGGEAPTDATTGAMLMDNVSTDTRHIVSGYASCEDAGNTLLLYDRIFQVNKTMNSTSAESVTGVPTRYQSSTTTAADYAGGNFLFIEVGGTALAATAHNWTTCTYRDDAGNDAQTLPSVTGNSGAIVRRLDQPAQTWFCPLASGDVGIMDLAQMQCSAAVATGVINFVIGHPLVWMPIPIANLHIIHDFVRGAFSLVRVFDDAALGFLEVMKPSTSSTTYNAGITVVHG
jgi:hypothetical protein